jgi:hypothetical protein
MEVCGLNSSGSYEQGNEISGPIKGGEFFDKLSDYHLLKKGSVPWESVNLEWSECVGFMV